MIPSDFESLSLRNPLDIELVEMSFALVISSPTSTGSASETFLTLPTQLYLAMIEKYSILNIHNRDFASMTTMRIMSKSKKIIKTIIIV